ncbi:MAG: 16S rRNA (guanine(966)-N(2))-methyltransferase RsmD [Actinomycetota bacterium]
MRVISGTAKGVRLARVPRGVRPVSDMAREGLFSSIATALPSARVLDLYAGTGALGIEALSRGAGHATFVERNPAANRTIAQNLERTRLSDRAQVVRADVLDLLSRDDKRGAPFDLVLADPPYDGPEEQVLAAARLLTSGWLAGHRWTVVLTRGTRSSMPVIPVDWRVARRLEYGDTLVLVFREV